MVIIFSTVHFIWVSLLLESQMVSGKRCPGEGDGTGKEYENSQIPHVTHLDFKFNIEVLYLCKWHKYEFLFHYIFVLIY